MKAPAFIHIPAFRSLSQPFAAFHRLSAQFSAFLRLPGAGRLQCSVHLSKAIQAFQNRSGATPMGAPLEGKRAPDPKPSGEV
jgi:hypothetical protein